MQNFREKNLLICLLIGILVTILFLPAVALAEENELKDEMISHWTLDDFFTSNVDIFDSYSGKQGTIYGATSAGAIESKIGQSLDFDGNSWVDLGGGSSITGATAFSISVWVKSSSTGLDATIWRARNTDDMMLRYDKEGWKSGGYDIIQFDVDTNSNTANAGVSGSGRARLESLANKQTTDWQHLVATWDGSNLALYINGSEDSPPVMIPNSGGTLYADRNYLAAAGNQGSWNGKLDEVAFWGRALSGEEIKNIYNNGIPVTYEVPGDGQLSSAIEAASSREKIIDTIEINTRNSGTYPEINGRTIKDYIKVPNGQDSSGLTLNYNTLLNNLTHDGTGTVNALFNYWGGGEPDVLGTGDVLHSTWLEEIPGTTSMIYSVDNRGIKPSEGYLKTAFNEAGTGDTVKILSPDEGPDTYDPVTGLTLEEDIVVPTGEDGSGLTLTYNDITGSLTHNGNGTIDALFNYWGSPPSIAGNTGNLLVSPWINTIPGTSSVTYVVDDIGATPPAGYLYTAFDAADGGDTVEILTDEGQDDYKDVTGLTINENVMVPAGESGTGLTMNYNNILGSLTHNGTSTVDALFNYWGADGPEVFGNTGNVTYVPWLGNTPGTSPMTYVVADAGNEPAGGYLPTAFGAAGSNDTVQVRTGIYDPVEDLIITEDVVVPTGGDGSGLTINYNNITGQLTHNGTGTVDALLNYWGSPPNVDGKIENILLSPWLLEEPGTENMTYKVATMGADPEGGLTRAIADANDDTFQDEIIVDEGIYNVSNSTGVTQPANIVTCTGCPTEASISGELSIEASDVKLGGRDGYVAQGFNIRGNVTVEGWVDASTVQINWNNIYGTVTNNGNNELDATYNWWGGEDPDDSTVGEVDYTPYLPNTVCSVLDYMEDNEIEDPKAAIAGMICGNGSSSQQAVCELTNLGLDTDQAEGLLNQYGLGTVRNAMNNANTSGQFVQLLNGFSLPAGAAGGLTNNTVAGGAGSVGNRTVGAVFTKCDSIEVGFPLADFEGNPATNLTPTVSLVRLDEDGNKKGLTKVTTATYDEEKAAYVASISSCELTPGYYLVQIDLPDLSALTQVIQVKSEEG